ncbi:MAG: hypothetical protein WCI21_04095 [Alphaproteobacteria bacterium]
MNGKIVTFAVVGILIAGQAAAATANTAQVSNVSGSVLASKNGSFSNATNTTTLSSGDRLVARDGTAQVRFSDGCVVTVKPQAMLTVGSSSPCATGAGLITSSNSTTAVFGDDPDGFKKATVTWIVLAGLLWLWGDSRNKDVVTP